jgi:hypothetical protein
VAVNNDLVAEIHARLENASPEQVRYVMARMHHSTDKAAAKEVGIHPNTVARWPNKAELDELVTMLLIDPLLAAVETLRLAAPDAARVLVRELRGKQKRQAANDILDRSGVARSSNLDVQSGGKPLVAGLAETLQKVYGDGDKPETP